MNILIILVSIGILVFVAYKAIKSFKSNSSSSNIDGGGGGEVLPDKDKNKQK